MNRPIKRINGLDGELLAVIDGRRYVIAKCRPRIEIYEHSTPINVLGSVRCERKTANAAIVICVDKAVADEITITQWESATSFELQGDFERNDGAWQKLNIKDIAPLSQNLSSEIWEFELLRQDDVIKDLMKF